MKRISTKTVIVFCFSFFFVFSFSWGNNVLSNTFASSPQTGTMTSVGSSLGKTLFPNNKTVRHKNNSREAYVDGEILVKYKEEAINLKTERNLTKEKSFLLERGVSKKDELKAENVSLLEIRDGKSVEDKIIELNEDPNILYAQPNYRYYPTSIDTNDPLKDYLWGLHNTGQEVMDTLGQEDKDIDAPEAWDIFERNSNPVIVAVIDSGVAYDHPDLVDNMWDGSNCLNELGEFLGGCSHGYDYKDFDKSPLPDSYYVEGNSHGTHIAGTIAAEIDNGIGMVGVASRAEIMALKTNSTTAQIIKAIDFAGLNGAKVINASWACVGGDWGGSSPTCSGEYGYNDNLMIDAIESFEGVFVAAAGNGGGDSDSYGDNHDEGETISMYPCDHTSSNIICVAATDQNDNLASWSDYGSTSVDVGAPGVNVLSTVNYNKIFEEDFEEVSINNFPNNWTKFPTNNYWGVRELLGSKVLYGDVYKPYFNNTDTIAHSPSFNLSNGTSANLKMNLLCDTEGYFWGEHTDYMSLWYADDSSGGIEEIASWNESDIRDLQHYISTDYGAYYPDFIFPISNNFLIEDFSFFLNWVTDSSVSDFWGCGVDNIRLYSNEKDYNYSHGTSMAAPHVSGIAALLWGYRPELSIAEVKSAILDTGDSVASLSGKTVTGKRVNAQNALLSVQGDVIETFVFSHEGDNYSCFINEKLKNIDCPLPVDIPKDDLSPIITLTGGSISPSSGIANDFTSGATYLYTKSDTTEELYNVSIKNYLRTINGYRSGTGNWDLNATKFISSGDFDNDGMDDISAMYDYGGGKMNIFAFESDGDQLTPRVFYQGDYGKWNVGATKYVVAGDFDNDGIDDLGAMYDYGGGKMNIFSFKSDGTKFIPKVLYEGDYGKWNVSSTRFVVSGDFNNDGKDDFGAMYDYGGGKMGIFSFEWDGEKLSPRIVYMGDYGKWNISATRFVVAGDFNGDGIGDMGAMYDYGGGKMNIFSFQSDGIEMTPTILYQGDYGKWNVNATKFLVSGDYNQDGIGDVAAMYDYGSGKMGIFSFQWNGSSLAPKILYMGDYGKWNVPATKFLSSGDYSGNQIDELSAMYDYNDKDVGIWIFK